MIRFLKKLFASKEVHAAIGILDELECTFDCDAFRIIRQEIEGMVLANPREFTDIMRNGTSPRQWVLGAVGNIAGDHVESGQYHVWRGVLNPMGPGEDFIKIYSAALDELVRMGVLEAKYASEQKMGLRRNIQSVG